MGVSRWIVFLSPGLIYKSRHKLHHTKPQLCWRNSSNLAPERIALACFKASTSSSRAVWRTSKFFCTKSQQNLIFNAAVVHPDYGVCRGTLRAARTIRVASKGGDVSSCRVIRYGVPKGSKSFSENRSEALVKASGREPTEQLKR